MAMHPSFSMWCDACDWNLLPAAEVEPDTGINSLLRRLGAQSSARLHQEFSEPNSLRPRVGLATIAAFIVSTSVFLVTILLVLAGITLITSGNFVAVFFGVLLLVIAFVLRPRIARMPKGAEPATEVPALASLAQDVAECVGTRAPDYILMSPEFNAAVHEAGIRRRRVLQIGLPLFALLDPQEQVAVLAHEFGHFANGDFLRGWYGSTALRSLLIWHYLFVPSSLFESDETGGTPGLLMLPINLVMLGISWIPLGLAYVLVTLLYRDSQRGEYMADSIAARVAGGDAAVSAFEKLHASSMYDGVAHSTGDEFWLNRSLMDEIRLRAAEYPERERERMKRIERKLAARLDLTHPPTILRIEAIQARGQAKPQLRVDPDRAAAIEAELRSREPGIQRQLIDAYRASLHY
jgi:Zn-dependent protease with chaperone function